MCYAGAPIPWASLGVSCQVSGGWREVGLQGLVCLHVDVGASLVQHHNLSRHTPAVLRAVPLSARDCFSVWVVSSPADPGDRCRPRAKCVKNTHRVCWTHSFHEPLRFLVTSEFVLCDCSSPRRARGGGGGGGGDTLACRSSARARQRSCRCPTERFAPPALTACGRGCGTR